MRVLPSLLLLLCLVGLPMGQAQLLPSQPYEATVGFSDDFESIPALVSGAIDYHGADARNATLLLGTTGFTVSGLERLCWESSGGGNRCEEGTGLSVELSDGGSAAFRTPKTYDVAMQAEHVLAFFANAGQLFGEDRPEQIALGQSIVAFPTEETITIDNVERLPAPPASSYSSFNDAVDDLALLLTLTANSTLVLRDGGDVLDTLEGEGAWAGFQGGPVFTPIRANVAALPMPDGATASFTRSPADAAREGLGGNALQDAFSSIEASEGEGDADALGDISDASDALAGFLNGAYLSLDSAGFSDESGPVGLLDTITLVRFENLDATRDGEQVQHEGSAPLQIQEGEVVGAKPLVGGIVPIWGVILWGLALILLVVRLVVKPKKEHKVWDKLNWVGWVGGLVAGIIVFFLWDLAMVNLWGTSIVTSGASGVTLGAIAALQLIPLLLAGLFFGLPTRSISKTTTRLAGQGRFMNIGGVIAPFVTLLLGVPFMLSLIAALLNLLPGLLGG